MRWRTFLGWLFVLVLLGGTGFRYWRLVAEWQGWLEPPPGDAGEGEHAHDHGDPNRLKLTPQAKANLGLKLAPLELTSHWRSLRTPGVVAERPGSSNRAVTTTLAGVVTKIAALPGQAVKPGEELFTLRLASEYLQNIQAQLYKTARDLEINADEQKRLRGVADGEALFKGRVLELGYEERRLRAALDTHRQDLASRGLSAAQIQQILAGTFLTDVAVTVPRQATDSAATQYEVEELKVQLGEPVQAGQPLAYLASHEGLDIEGKAFEQEAAALLKAAREGLPIQATFLDQTDAEWPPFKAELKIRHIANHVDPATRLLSFYLPLPNEWRETKDAAGGAKRAWRFRPGQRVRLRLPIEKVEGVFVLPRAAIAREGAETYVFRANGDLLERKPVHVRFEDAELAVLANDGSVTAGTVVAQNAAAALNRALKNQSGGGAEDGTHVHADGTVHGKH